jgi:hypothetical protein
MAWIRSVGLLAVVSVALVAVVACSRSRAPPGDVTVNNGTPRRVELVEWAADAFRSSGLRWPPVREISFPPTNGCSGEQMGSYAATDEGCRIEVCAVGGLSNREGAFPLTVKYILLHELGHCWVDAYVDDLARVQFMDLRQLDCWHCDTFWQERGFEHAAEVIAWGVSDTFYYVHVSPRDCQSMNRAFMLLTGQQPLLRIADCSDELIDHYSDELIDDLH